MLEGGEKKTVLTFSNSDVSSQCVQPCKRQRKFILHRKGRNWDGHVFDYAHVEPCHNCPLRSLIQIAARNGRLIPLTQVHLHVATRHMSGADNYIYSKTYSYGIFAELASQLCKPQLVVGT